MIKECKDIVVASKRHSNAPIFRMSEGLLLTGAIYYDKIKATDSDDRHTVVVMEYFGGANAVAIFKNIRKATENEEFLYYICGPMELKDEI